MIRFSHPLLLLLLCALCMPRVARGEEPVVLDGISVLISSSAGDDASSIPVLASDVELIVRLLLVSTRGAKWNEKKIDSAMRFNARRLAVLVRLLAHSANLVGEKIKPVDRDAMVREFEKQAGGRGQLGLLLNQCGASENELTYWVTNFLLAHQRLNYLGEQIEMPSETELKVMFAKGDHRFGDASYEEAGEAYVALIKDKELQKVLSQWVESVLVHGKVIFAR